ncbi:hypothetical protein Slin15195_G073090 [Septoria linicola]|uniref:Uncharacterized protein n=1 Tax=Septoria linicola TaxID=215465 RepID=A0A9Q9ARW9_9PEZI|nr:hypothetical protein Slin14017_G105810 [Septoria linicola]USW53990.1 hypothetical protein Slin15195_G073090 [Septoria linicola]
MSVHPEEQRPPARMSQRDVQQDKSAWQQLKQKLFCCWKVDVSDRNQDSIEQGHPPPYPASEARNVPPRPRRPSEHELSERLRTAGVPRSSINPKPTCTHNRTKAVSQLPSIVNDSPTARLVPREQDPEPEPKLTARTTSYGTSSTSEQWRRLHDEQQEEQVRYQAQVMKPREAQSLLTGDIDSHDAKDKDKSKRKEPAAFRSKSANNVTGRHFRERSQQRFEDMRGIGEASTPTLPPRTKTDMLVSGDLKALPSMRRRLEAERQASAVEAKMGGEDDEQERDTSEVLSRRLPTPHSSPRAVSGYVSPSQIRSSPIRPTEAMLHD